MSYTEQVINCDARPSDYISIRTMGERALVELRVKEGSETTTVAIKTRKTYRKLAKALKAACEPLFPKKEKDEPEPELPPTKESALSVFSERTIEVADIVDAIGFAIKEPCRDAKNFRPWFSGENVIMDIVLSLDDAEAIAHSILNKVKKCRAEEVK